MRLPAELHIKCRSIADLIGWWCCSNLDHYYWYEQSIRRQSSPSSLHYYSANTFYLYHRTKKEISSGNVNNRSTVNLWRKFLFIYILILAEQSVTCTTKYMAYVKAAAVQIFLGRAEQKLGRCPRRGHLTQTNAKHRQILQTWNTHKNVEN